MRSTQQREQGVPSQLTAMIGGIIMLIAMSMAGRGAIPMAQADDLNDDCVDVRIAAQRGNDPCRDVKITNQCGRDIKLRYCFRHIGDPADDYRRWDCGAMGRIRDGKTAATYTCRYGDDWHIWFCDADEKSCRY
jgi:hypothetical protein